MKKLLYAFLCTLSLLTGCSGGGGSDGPDPGPGPQPTEPYFNASLPGQVGISYMGSPLGFIINTNQDINAWTVTADAAWCHPVKDEFQFSITCDEYRPTETNGQDAYVEPRQCHVTVRCGQLFNKTFTVFQESRTAIRVPQETVYLSADGETRDITVYNNCYEIRASVENNPSWLSVSIKDKTTITLVSVARAQGVSTPRTANVIVESDLTEGRYRIVVKDADANLDTQDYNYGNQTDWD